MSSWRGASEHTNDQKSHYFTQSCLQSRTEERNTTAKQVPDCKSPINFTRIASFLACPPPPQPNCIRVLEPSDDTQRRQSSRMSVSDFIWAPASLVPTVRSGSVRNVCLSLTHDYELA